MHLKAKDNLTSVWEQLSDFVVPGSKVIEWGCGNGALLQRLSGKISYGLGIDKSKKLIDYARKQKESAGSTNIEFICRELGEHYEDDQRYDFAIASLFFHVIPVPEAVYLVKKLEELSQRTIICALTHPETFKQKMVLWLDQRFSDHYDNFIAYKKAGYMKGILERCGYTDFRTYDTSIPFVKIYILP
ncbi:class I SAM-dependent methyltransferase [Algoriphagus resistens]|uniref:class I SAM-dependent methyltransferase n=1 Tax=Algoriphagus resistens TaxID=1750590 RepID=UPI0007168701|nr:class I SAM-dependent methyltransferase [Algoriphagus resistens]